MKSLERKFKFNLQILLVLYAFLQWCKMQLLSLILMILVQITERLCSGILMIGDDIFSQCTIFQVSAINNINAMLAQATSSIRNENESLLAGKNWR